MLKEGTIIEPGQELAESAGYGAYRSYSIVKVDRITPSGQIILTNGNRFYADGREKTSSNYKTHLELITPEIRAIIEREDNLDYVKACQWKKIDDNTLREVVALLKKAEK